jgi:hypothetical protein
MSEPSAALSRAQIYELLAHLLASADTCTFEPGFYGTFRLIDAASRLAGAALDGGLDDPWLAELKAEIDKKKLWMMTDREAYFAYLGEAAASVAARMAEEAGR